MIGSLFSGIGGLELGLERALGWPVAWQVEIDEWCRSVLAAHWPAAERFSDVSTVGSAVLRPVDLICGGFPCQDVSSAGRGAGVELLELRPAGALELPAGGLEARPARGTNKGGAAGRVGQDRPSLATLARLDLWATPTASDGRSGATLREYGNARPLREQVLWPTATAADAKASGSAGPHDVGTPRGGESGSRAAARLRLSPWFVEALMGFPAGWTDVVSSRLETQSSPSAPR